MPSSSEPVPGVQFSAGRQRGEAQPPAVGAQRSQARQPACGGKKPATVTSANARLAAAGVPTTYAGLARRLEAVTVELEAMAASLPEGTPDGAEAKALRSAVGKLSAAAGGLKKAIPGLNLPGGV